MQNIIMTGDEVEGLSKSLAINMLIFFRKNPDNDYGTREIQRLLNIKSSSTAQSYLKQLADLGLVIKDAENRYRLTEKGKTYDNLSYPVFQHINYIRGQYLPKYSFLLTFLVMSFLTTTILLVLKVNLGIIVLNSLISLMVVFVVILREWFESRDRYTNFLDLQGLS